MVKVLISTIYETIRGKINKSLQEWRSLQDLLLVCVELYLLII
ncbi:hypothetical protein DSBG_3984 [Desulfosporosinus sp. BG]|nr:hypothetical protein DSBG_3984 [Desulfosporosinus sp. BG]